MRCKALQIFYMMDRWMCVRKLAYVRTDKWTSSAFFCYYVLTKRITMSSFLARTRNLIFMDYRMYYFCRWHLCRHLDKIPGPGQGWRCRGHCAVFSGCLLVFKTEEHKNKRFALNSKYSFKRTWCSFAIQCICIIDAELTTLFCLRKNRSYHSITIVAIPSFLAETRNLMFMDCSLCFKLSPTLCRHLNKIPGPGQGWRCRDTCCV